MRGKHAGAMPAIYKGAALRAYGLCEVLVERQSGVRAKLDGASANVYAINLATNIIDTGHTFSEMLELLRRHCESVPKWSSFITAAAIRALCDRCAIDLVEQSPAAQGFLVYVLGRCKQLDNARIHEDVVKQMNAESLIVVNNYAKLLQYSPLSQEASQGLQCLVAAVGSEASTGGERRPYYCAARTEGCGLCAMNVC